MNDSDVSAYILSAYSFISTDSTEDLLNFGNPMKDGNPIPSFDESTLIRLCSEAKQIFSKESNTLELEGDFIIVGDIHGSLHDLLRILKFIQENKSKVLFLGDYVDRGCFSLECITLLFAIKVAQPDSFYLIRGNHEFDLLCSQYGFKHEVINYYNPKSELDSYDFGQIKKSQSLILDPAIINSEDDDEYFEPHADMFCYRYTEKLYNAFIDAFAYLPIAAILNKTTFCIHGGLSPKFSHIESINKSITRPIYSFESNELMADLVWGDPFDSSVKFEENPRGRGFLFNRETVVSFLKNNSLVRMIRAHQCVEKGSLFHFGEKCITVFSASSYNHFNGNSSAVLQLFQKDDSIRAQIFDPLPRLQKSEAEYYKVQAKDFGGGYSHKCFSLLHPNLKAALQLSKNKTLLPFIIQRSNPLVKPKFITNQRKSCIVVKPKLNSSKSMEVFNND